MSDLEEEDVIMEDDNLHDFCENCFSYVGEDNLQEYSLHRKQIFACETCAEDSDFKIVL